MDPSAIYNPFDHLIAVSPDGDRIAYIERNRLWMRALDRTEPLELADRGYALELGRNRFSDTGAALLASQDVRKMYLGG